MKNVYVGAAVEAMVQSRLMAHGINTATPLLDNGYDMLSEFEGNINRLQIRTTSCKQPTSSKKNFHYRLHTNRNRRMFSVFIAYIIPEDALYIIPEVELKNIFKITIPVGKPCKYDKYKDAYEILEKAH